MSWLDLDHLTFPSSLTPMPLSRFDDLCIFGMKCKGFVRPHCPEARVLFTRVPRQTYPPRFGKNKYAPGSKWYISEYLECIGNLKVMFYIEGGMQIGVRKGMRKKHYYKQKILTQIWVLQFNKIPVFHSWMFFCIAVSECSTVSDYTPDP